MSDIEDYTICILVVPNPYFQLIQVMIDRERANFYTISEKMEKCYDKNKTNNKSKYKSSYWRLISKPWQFMPLKHFSHLSEALTWPTQHRKMLRRKFSDIVEAMITPVEGVTLLVLNGIGNARRYSSNTGDQWPGCISLFRL